MIKLNQLTKKFKDLKTPVLDNLTYSFQSTGLYYIIGKSGSGKTTLLSLIGAIDDEYGGEIIVDDKRLKDFTKEEVDDYRFSYISYVFQDFKTDEKETVKENLLKPLAITSLSEEMKEKRITKALKKVGLSEKLNSTFKSLSGGEKKRISLAKALVKDSKVLLVDEPISSLNEKLKKQITDILVLESKTKLVIIITHEVLYMHQEATVLKLYDGKLITLKENNFNDNTKLDCIYKRVPLARKPLYSQIYSQFKNNKQFFLIVILSLVVAFFSISFSFLLSSSVKASMNEALSSYMDANSMVMKNKEEEYTGNSFEEADSHFLNKLKANHEDKIISIDTFYLDSLNNIFQDNQSVQINYLNRYLPLDFFSLNSFLETKTVEELNEEEKIIGRITELQDDEIVLGLKEENLTFIYYLLTNERKTNIDQEELLQIENYLNSNSVFISVIANKDEWKYYNKFQYTLTGLILSTENFIFSSTVSFNTYFVNELMKFKERNEDDKQDEDNPASLRKAKGIRIKHAYINSFLEDFLLDQDAENYLISKFEKLNEYVSFTDNWFLIHKDYLPKISLSKVKSYITKHEEKISQIAYSTNIFTYTASGYISGFKQPFFFSRYKDKLNKIQDDYHESSQNLGSFQSSLFEVEETVIKADLLSSNEKDGLSFKTIDIATSRPILGEVPNSYDEIGISVKLAEKLFGSAFNALGNYLHSLTLEETIYQDEDSYINNFKEGVLKIVAIYDESEKNVFYQKALFPLIYYFNICNMKKEDLRISEVVLTVDLNAYSSDYYKEAFSEYNVTFPMLIVLNEIEKTLDKFSMIFIFFAIFATIIAIFLQCLTLYLVIKKNKKQIGILLVCGYRKTDIINLYFHLSLFITLLSYLLSVLLTFISHLSLNHSLNELFTSFKFSFHPYLISLSISTAIILLVRIIFGIFLKKIQPKDAFEK